MDFDSDDLIISSVNDVSNAMTRQQVSLQCPERKPVLSFFATRLIVPFLNAESPRFTSLQEETVRIWVRF